MLGFSPLASRPIADASVSAVVGIACAAAWAEADDAVAVLVEVAADTVSAAAAWNEADDAVNVAVNVSLDLSAAIAWVEAGDVISIAAESQITFARAPSGSGYSPRCNARSNRPPNIQGNCS
jgi:hypothetical protein